MIIYEKNLNEASVSFQVYIVLLSFKALYDRNVMRIISAFSSKF